jgi:alkylresorcinol/alkylpyrone synthase
LSSSPRLSSIATATAPYPLLQADVREFARGFFSADFPHLDRLLRAFDHAGIDARQLGRPLSWFREPHSFADKNAAWREVATDLGHTAATRAIEASGVARRDFAAFVFVSSTGIATPSLDAHLVQSLELPRSIARTPIWGLGCAGGAAGLGRAAALCRGLQRPVLLVAAEVCSATFLHDDRSKSNLIATALFGDGAAAAVLSPGGPGPHVLGAHSHLIDDSTDVMGWTLRDDGLQVRFSRSIPGIVRSVAPRFVADTMGTVGATRADIDWWALHPGGAKVLDAYTEALQLRPEQVHEARDVLREHGNMSSPTALFVLERLLRTPPSVGSLGLCIGLGPGFCAEAVVLRGGETP